MVTAFTDAYMHYYTLISLASQVLSDSIEQNLIKLFQHLLHIIKSYRI